MEERPEPGEGGSVREASTASIVFGAGTSHTPMLNAAAEEWPLFEELDRQRPLFKDGRQATYDELLALAPPSLQAELAPNTMARRHGEAMAALALLQQELAAAALDAVVVIGDDQKEIYHDDLMPSVLIYRGETIPNVPNRTRRPAPGLGKRPAWAQRASARYYEDMDARHYPVHARLATPRVRHRIRQRPARRRGRGPRLRLCPPAHHEWCADSRRPSLSQHLLPAQPALAAALL
jgi:hypothetical protein